MVTGIEFVNSSDPYEKQCDNMYKELNSRTGDYMINGVMFDPSNIREAENELRSYFTKLMKAVGYDRYHSDNIADWFRYTIFLNTFRNIVVKRSSLSAVWLYLLSQL